MSMRSTFGVRRSAFCSAALSTYENINLNVLSFLPSWTALHSTALNAERRTPNAERSEACPYAH